MNARRNRSTFYLTPQNLQNKIFLLRNYIISESSHPDHQRTVLIQDLQWPRCVARSLSCFLNRNNNCHQFTSHFDTPRGNICTSVMYLYSLCVYFLRLHVTRGDITQDDVGYLSELPLDKLLRLKNSLQVLVKSNYDNLTSTSTNIPARLDLRMDHFGAQALGLMSPAESASDTEYLQSRIERGDEHIVTDSGVQALGLKSASHGDALKSPIKRGDEWEGLTNKGDHSKMSNIFSTAVTVLAFLAFGGYLLCLIVQAIRSKQNYNQLIATTIAPTTVILNSGIKKRPQTHFASSAYGRRKRDVNMGTDMDLPPEQLFTALLDLCEGYTKWSKQYRD